MMAPAAALMIGLAVQVVPSLTAVFPPEDDGRRPDLTVADAEGAGLLAYSADGRMLATAGGRHTIRLWNARPGASGNGEALRTLAGHRARLTALAFAPDGTTLVAMAADGAARTWEVTSGRALRATSLRAAAGRVVALRPGKEPHLAVASAARAAAVVELWDHQAGTLVRKLERPSELRGRAAGAARSLAFTSDGKLLAAGLGRGVVAVWDAETGALVRAFEGAAVKALAVAPSHVAAGASNGTVRWWALPGGGDDRPAPLQTVRHPGAVIAVAISGKADQIAAAGADGAITVWDLATGRRLCTQVGHRGAVAAVAFSPNGQKMASTGADRSWRSWTVPLPPVAPPELEAIAAAVPARAAVAAKRPRRLLVFWRADAILHKAGVPAANEAIEAMARKTGAFTAEFSRDYQVFTPEVLGRFDAIVLNSTAHLALPDEAQKAALLDYVKRGGGVVGIHAAIDMFKDWPEGAAIVGATFAGHPWVPSGTWSVRLEERDHPLTRAWQGLRGFKLQDEFYELGPPYSRADRRVLISLDLGDAATAGVTPLHRADRDFAVAWIKRFGAGRVFYGMFGHRAEPFRDPAVLRFYLDGIQYALGDLPADDSPRAGSVLP